jgi:hypothetical protein
VAADVAECAAGARTVVLAAGAIGAVKSPVAATGDVGSGLAAAPVAPTVANMIAQTATTRNLPRRDTIVLLVSVHAEADRPSPNGAA